MLWEAKGGSGSVSASTDPAMAGASSSAPSWEAAAMAGMKRAGARAQTCDDIGPLVPYLHFVLGPNMRDPCTA
jgi:hypothetical protein